VLGVTALGNDLPAARDKAYAAAKQRLFLLPGLRDAVINTDDEAGRRFAAALPATLRLTTVGTGTEPGIEGARRLQITSVTPTPGGLTLGIDGSWGRAQVDSPLVGGFNAENLAVVLGVLLAWGFPLDRAAGALAGCNAPPGRMEAFRSRGGVVAIVDYAHTPDALEKVLAAARAHCTGRLSVVFGCGGDRDRGKRPLMGAIAERLADAVLVTDDNPRTEDGNAIVAGILAGMREPARARVVRDRAAAIAEAVEGARGGDVVVVAGKGHEDYQLVGSERRAYSDRDVARRLAEALP
jgi:UDP-N-acetylmuramoyl-L-alanyl-D-glutamate--2,6-diaminopimelate ligase